MATADVSTDVVRALEKELHWYSRAQKANGSSDCGRAQAARESETGFLRASVAACEGALERVENGTYGTCQQCGRRIEKGRLKVLPTTDRCGKCAKRTEQ